MQYVSVRLGDHDYGLPIYAIREITRPLMITPVQGASRSVCGLINLRGQIITVIDLALQLRRDEAVGGSGSSRFVVVKSNSELSTLATEAGLMSGPDPAALYVDEVNDILDVDADQIDEAPEQSDAQIGRMVDGVVQLSDRLVTLLSVPPLLDS